MLWIMHVCLYACLRCPNIKKLVWHSMRLLLSPFLLAVCPNVHAFPVDIVLTSMCTHTVTHLVWIPGLDMAAHFKDDVSHHFSPPDSSSALGQCWQLSDAEWHAVRHQTSWHLPSLCDSSWLTMAASLTVSYPASPWPGFQMLSLLRGGMSSFSPLGTWKHSQRKWHQHTGIQRCVNDKIL